MAEPITDGSFGAGQNPEIQSRRALTRMSAHAKVISFTALRRARTTIEDFALSYLPLHALRVPEDFFKFWDVLVFVEAAIYEMDEENEELAAKGTGGDDVTLAGEQVLMDVLSELGLLSYQIRLQLLQGKMYWRRERQLCCVMASGSGGRGSPMSIEEIHATSEAKSFDYRLLNHLLYGLRGYEPDPRLLQFLFFDEHLVDIGDDLHDYEEDVLKNSFNIFRAYVHLYGHEAERLLVQRIADFEQKHEAALAALPPWMQEAHRERRRTATAVPGSEKWVIPRPILDEAAFRRDCSHAQQQGYQAGLPAD